MKKIYLFVCAVVMVSVAKAQTVSTFMDTGSFGCSGLAIENGHLYVAASGGNIHRKALNDTSTTYDTFPLGASGYRAVCEIGDFLYVSKPYNGGYGIYRFNPDLPNYTVELFISMTNVFGMTHRNSELYFSGADKIYKVDLTLANPTPVQIAANIDGDAGFTGSTMGLKIYDGFLYLTENTAITRINLDSGNFEKETVTPHTGRSFAKGDDGMLYVTALDYLGAIYKVDLLTQTETLLVTIPGFIGAHDIVFHDDALYVTTIEGSYDEVARVDLNDMAVAEFNPKKLMAYPNPATDRITLKEIDPDEEVSIIDPTGKLVQTLKAGNGTINVSGLPAGVYFIKQKNVYGKFVKK